MEFTVVKIVRAIFDWPQRRVHYKTTTVLLFLEVSRQLMIHGKIYRSKSCVRACKRHTISADYRKAQLVNKA